MKLSPAPIDVVPGSNPAQWWDVLGALGPLAILLGAILAAVIGGFTLSQRTKADALALEQKRRADDRSEWWRRAEWALDHALDNNPSTKALGLATLEVLARSKLAHAEELELFDIAWESVNDPDISSPAGDGSPADGDAPATGPRSGPLPTGVLAQAVAQALKIWPRRGKYV